MRGGSSGAGKASTRTPKAAPRAATTASPALRPQLRESVYQEKWVPDLIYELRGAESRPITRLVRGLTFALGLLVSAHKIAGHLAPVPADHRNFRLRQEQFGPVKILRLYENGQV